MSREAGFSLVEVLVALALAAMILVYGFAFYFQAEAGARRLALTRAVSAALENNWEQLEGNTTPLFPAPRVLLPIAPPVMGSSPVSILLDVHAVPTFPHGLYRVDLTAVYSFSGQPIRRTREGLIWLP